MVRVVVDTGGLDASIASISATITGRGNLILRASIDGGKFSHLSQTEVERHKVNGNLIDCASMEEAEKVVEVFNNIRVAGHGITLGMALNRVRYPDDYVWPLGLYVKPKHTS